MTFYVEFEEDPAFDAYLDQLVTTEEDFEPPRTRRKRIVPRARPLRNGPKIDLSHLFGQKVQ